MTMGDIQMAPYMARFCALEVYRSFFIPNNIPKWHRWVKNVMRHPAVTLTL
jgi:glutathione S-transferase